MTDYLLWILPANWLVWGIIAPTKEGTRPMHTLWGITLPAGDPYVAVQERGEFRLSKLLGTLTGLPFVLIPTPETPVVIMLIIGAQVVAMIIADNVSRGMNAVDYAGHEAEIMAAERAGEAGYREAETARMQAKDNDKQGQDVAAGLKRMRWLARVVFVLGRLP